MKSVTTNRYYKNAEIRDKGIKYFIDFLNANIQGLSRDNQTKVYSLAEGYRLEGKLTDKQYNLLESLYEKAMGANDLPCCKLKHDFRKGLRY